MFTLTSLLVWFDTSYAIHIVLPILTMFSILGLREITKIAIRKTGKPDIVVFCMAILVLGAVFVPEFIGIGK